MAWQVQEAKQRFSELVRRALESGPQIITRHGHDAVVSAEEFERLKGGRNDFKKLLRSAPDLDRLKISRDQRRTRRVRL